MKYLTNKLVTEETVLIHNISFTENLSTSTFTFSFSPGPEFSVIHFFALRY